MRNSKSLLKMITLSMLIALGVTIAIYIIGWFIISSRVRKGDLC